MENDKETILIVQGVATTFSLMWSAQPLQVLLLVLLENLLDSCAPYDEGICYLALGYMAVRLIFL